MPLRERIETWSAEQRWTPPADAVDRLETLVALWRRYAGVVNLTGRGADPEALAGHVLDGLETVLCARAAGWTEGAWLDVGSGGGFPGLVIAAASAYPLLLVEPRAKRAAFLELALGALDRPETWVLRARVDRSTWHQVQADARSRGAPSAFLIASARAVWSPSEWWQLGAALAAPGGGVLVHAKAEEQPDLPRPAARVTGALGTVLAIPVP